MIKLAQFTQGSACEHFHSHWITVSYHGVESPMTTGYYCAIFPFCGGGKKTDDKKKGVLWLGYHRYTSNDSLVVFFILEVFSTPWSHLTWDWSFIRPSSFRAGGCCGFLYTVSLFHLRKGLSMLSFTYYSLSTASWRDMCAFSMLKCLWIGIYRRSILKWRNVKWFPCLHSLM